MSERINRTGERFGRLTVVRFVGTGKNWVGIWECVCDCGNTVNVQYNNLHGGTTKSCGCLKLEKLIKRSTKHGLTGGQGHYTRLYRIWLNEPLNCRWATRKEQARNTRQNRLITFNGQTKTMAEWAEYLSISHVMLRMRFHRGWPVERALTTPSR